LRVDEPGVTVQRLLGAGDEAAFEVEQLLGGVQRAAARPETLEAHDAGLAEQRLDGRFHFHEWGAVGQRPGDRHHHVAALEGRVGGGEAEAAEEALGCGLEVE
jgi:hypothetical protein